jgi:uncharacterized protein involved in exopolysaccharide biosynthesis
MSPAGHLHRPLHPDSFGDAMRTRSETDTGRSQETEREPSADPADAEARASAARASRQAPEQLLQQEALRISQSASRSLPAGESALGGRSQFGLDLSIRPYLVLLLRYRILIIASIILTVALSVTRVLISPRMYVGKATILPSGDQSGAGVMGLLAGITGSPPMGSLVEDNSSMLFPTILESRAVGLEVLKAHYKFQMDGQAVDKTLEEYLQAENTDQALKFLEAIRAFDVNKETGVITVSARTPYPELSAQIVDHFLDNLERLNLEMHREAARQNHVFMEERQTQSLKELSEAEDRLAQFQEGNVRINAADLALEQLRLQRDVQLKQTVYTTLTSQEQVARIEEAKDLTVVKVLDRAEVPKLPEPIPKVSTLAIGLIAGTLLAVMAVAGIEVFHYLRREWLLCLSR